ncbi:MAG: BlaI/MecI/CopY family transcriptional regulator [Bacteroidia bacterium]|jgi:predicted transcriptional regulator|nr:BlaI/MecI/CopY family transcriptional regulator [Bacteroidia bacterium]
MESLNAKEEQVMQLIWKRKKALVSDLLEDFDDPKPPQSTLSSIVRKLEEMGYLGHKAYGRTHEYFPLISKGAYKKMKFERMIADYFEGSYQEVVSFMLQEQALSAEELARIQQMIGEEEEKT